MAKLCHSSKVYRGSFMFDLRGSGESSGGDFGTKIETLGLKSPYSSFACLPKAT